MKQLSPQNIRELLTHEDPSVRLYGVMALDDLVPGTKERVGDVKIEARDQIKVALEILDDYERKKQ